MKYFWLVFQVVMTTAILFGVLHLADMTVLWERVLVGGCIGILSGCFIGWFEGWRISAKKRLS